MGGPIIHCIGDSHVSFFSGEDVIQPVWPSASNDRLPRFKTYHIGATLAYNLPREGTRTRGREKLFEILSQNAPTGATVLLSFGEIDCRVHLVKQAQKNNTPIDEVVNDCLDQYFKVVADIAALGYQLIIYNAVLSRPRLRGVHRTKEDAYATYGTTEERNEAIRIFNAGAKKRCGMAGVFFLENIPHLTDRRGLIPTWYFFDSIHLSQRAMPVTLRELAAMFPALGLEIPAIPSASLMNRFGDWFTRRKTRLLKEFRKVFL